MNGVSRWRWRTPNGSLPKAYSRQVRPRLSGSGSRSESDHASDDPHEPSGGQLMDALPGQPVAGPTMPDPAARIPRMPADAIAQLSASPRSPVLGQCVMRETGHKPHALMPARLPNAAQRQAHGGRRPRTGETGTNGASPQPAYACLGAGVG